AGLGRRFDQLRYQTPAKFSPFRRLRGQNLDDEIAPPHVPSNRGAKLTISSGSRNRVVQHSKTGRPRSELGQTATRPKASLCQLPPAADIVPALALVRVVPGGNIRGPTTTRYFRGARRKKVLFFVTPMRPHARPTNAASCTFATSGLRWQAHAARTDQARIGRLEAPEGPADRAFEVNVLIVGAAERKVSRQHVAVRNRHKTDDDAARVDFDDAA